MRFFFITGAIFLLFICMVPLNSCKHDPMDIEKYDTISFKDVEGIFKSNCYSCHDGSEEDFDASSYQTIMKSITPGNAAKSEVYNVITNAYVEIMPPAPNTPLNKEQRTLIALWINLGAKE